MGFAAPQVIAAMAGTPSVAAVDSRRSAPLLVRLALGVLLIAGSAAFVPLVIPYAANSDDGSGSAIAQVVFVGSYLLLLGAAWLRPTARPRGTAPDLLALLVVGLAVASVTWSLDSSVSVRRSIGLVLTVVGASVLPRLMSLREMLGVLRATAWVALGSSLLWSLWSPEAASDMTTPDALRGVFTTKNELGRFAGFSFVVFVVSALLSHGGSRVLARLGALVALACVVLSHSATSLTVAVLMVPLMMTLDDVRRRGTSALRWIVPTAVAAAAAALAAWSILELSGLTRLVGRDSNFTGRMDLWQLVLEAVGRKPWFGYGYQAFWVASGGPADDIRARLPFDVPHAHNGFLDLTLELGLIGTVLVVALLLRGGARSVRCLAGGSAAGLAATALLVWMVMSNITESNLLRANSCFLVTLFALFGYVGEWLAQHPPSRS